MSSVSGCIMVGFKIGYAVATALKNLKIGYQIAENDVKRVKNYVCITKCLCSCFLTQLQKYPNSYFH